MKYKVLAESGNDVNWGTIPCVCLMYWVKARNAESKYSVTCWDSKPIYSACQKSSGWDSKRTLLHMPEAFSLRLKADPPAYVRSLLVATQSGLSYICQKPSGWDSKRTFLHTSEAFWLRLKANSPAYVRSLLVETQSGPSCICQKRLNLREFGRYAAITQHTQLVTAFHKPSLQIVAAQLMHLQGRKNLRENFSLAMPVLPRIRTVTTTIQSWIRIYYKQKEQ